MTDETRSDEDTEKSAETNAETSERETAESAEAIAEEQDAAEGASGKSAEQLESELDDLRERLLRAVAETENTRKRTQRELQDTRAYAVTGFARDMLDIADNLSRAIAAVSDEAREKAPESVKTLIEGVEMTERRLHSTLERHGVKKLEPQPGEPLDPNRHQAAAQVPADQPKGRIAHVMQPGYVIGERTLRAAMVVVSAGPAEGGDTASKPGSGGNGQDKGGSKDCGGVDVSA